LTWQEREDVGAVSALEQHLVVVHEKRSIDHERFSNELGMQLPVSEQDELVKELWMLANDRGWLVSDHGPLVSGGEERVIYYDVEEPAPVVRVLLSLHLQRGWNLPPWQ